MKNISIIIPLLLLLSCGGKGSYEPGSLAGLLAPDMPDQSGAARDYWKMDEDTELYHFSRGEGRNVLLIHGGPAMPFEAAWPGLEDIAGFRFHYYHQRGCGKSTIPFREFPSSPWPENAALLEEKLGLSRHLEDIERIRRILGEEKLILIGHSFGGFLATLYAREFPGRVERMILVEPADMLALPNRHGGMDQIEKWLSPSQKKEYKAFIGDYFNYGRFFKRTEEELSALNGKYGDFYFAALENRYPGSAIDSGNPSATAPGGFAGHAPFFSLGKKYDYRDELQAIDCPVLVIHGKKDLYGPGTSREYAELFPQGVYNEMGDSTHFPYEEEPNAFRKLVEEFLRS